MAELTQLRRALVGEKPPLLAGVEPCQVRSGISAPSLSLQLQRYTVTLSDLVLSQTVLSLMALQLLCKQPRCVTVCQGTHTDKTRAKLQSKGQRKTSCKQMVGLMERTEPSPRARAGAAGFINQGQKEGMWARGSGRPGGSEWRGDKGGPAQQSFRLLTGLPSAWRLATRFCLFVISPQTATPSISVLPVTYFQSCRQMIHHSLGR